jgi:secondary thiamine-phosphate synthase enzyme
MRSIAATLLINISSLIVCLWFLLPTLSVVTCFVIPAVPGSFAQTTAETETKTKHQTICKSSSSQLDNEIDSNTMVAGGVPKWFQHELSITAPSRGCHLITRDIEKAISKDVNGIKIGMCNLFVQHTSASLTLNENADPDVRRDLETALNKIVPASWNHDGTFKHTMEGDDDMPGHVKTSLMGPSLNIPIRNGRLALGTWQGIYLNEHRDQGGWGGGHTRRIIVTLQGQG